MFGCICLLRVFKVVACASAYAVHILVLRLVVSGALSRRRFSESDQNCDAREHCLTAAQSTKQLTSKNRVCYDDPEACHERTKHQASRMQVSSGEGVGRRELIYHEPMQTLVRSSQKIYAITSPANSFATARIL